MEDAPTSQEIRPPSIESAATVGTPTITVEVVWDTVSLTLAIAFLGVLISVVGVLVAPMGWLWRGPYAAASLLCVAAVFWIRPIRHWTIRFIRGLPGLPRQ